LNNKVIGILGGGQLGRMLVQKGLDFGLNFKILDPDQNAPCSVFSGFSVGNITDFNDVYQFGKGCDLITIEIESVNVEALKKLQEEGKEVYPQPEIIEIIQDKRLQKHFYKQHNLPTAAFELIDDKAQLLSTKMNLPFVQKLGREGYDGKGVKLMKRVEELENGFEEPSLIEELVAIDKEVSVIVARNLSGEVETYPPVEMVFHPERNLVDYLISPADVSTALNEKMVEIARDLAHKLNLVGILAVEMFIDKKGNVVINESAPRPHNSGHQTIEANVTSQYEQLIRSMLNWPLGNTSTNIISGMINLLGEEGHEGKTKYSDYEAILKNPGCYPHVYGKRLTKPGRKMGHVTVVGENRYAVQQKIEEVKRHFKVISE